MRAARNFLWILVFSWLACSADCAEPPGLLFRLSFDNQTLTADFAAGQANPHSQTAVEGFRFTDGVRGKGLVLQPGQQCAYALGNRVRVVVWCHFEDPSVLKTRRRRLLRPAAPRQPLEEARIDALGGRELHRPRSQRRAAAFRQWRRGAVSPRLEGREPRGNQRRRPAHHPRQARRAGARGAPIVRSGSRWPLARPLTSWPPPAPSSPSVSTCRPRARRCRPR